ncbi:hypothetical protein [Halobacterium litoreum]|uniref:Uncharacterized protein n=1 Tax=Halobacterium litoreum TaxID=2039234 RepID=A0ABD5NE81_9EURY|nr:hypothetical protein [Halobacterium litoreum]UHH13778.1 hypothetical protein LT972_01985 [Halobacterium litoreum]
MAGEGAVLVLFLLLGVGGALALYYFVRREAEDTDRMSREEARERVSREQDDARK